MMWILLVGFSCMLIWYCFIKPLSYWSQIGIKQTKPWIFFGDSWLTVFRIISLTEFIEKVYNMYPDCRYMGFYQFTRPTLLIRDPELIKQITVRDFDYFTDHKFFIDNEADPLWGGNLFALEGKKWREMRATLSRIFTTSKLKHMFTLMEVEAENFVKYYLDKNEDILEVDVKDIFSRYTSDMIATTAFGIKVDSFKEPNNLFYKMGKEIINLTGIITNIKIVAHIVMPKVVRILKIAVLPTKAATFFKTIIYETIKTREEKGVVRPDMINLLLEVRKDIKIEESQAIKEKADLENFKQYRTITDEDIASQAFVFFLAAFDTVALVTCFTTHELAFNTDIQDKLRKEIRKTYEENDGKLTYDSLIQMKYMDMVVSESMRKWPPGIFLDRVCTKPYTIEAVGPNESPVHLNVGDTLWIPAYGIHRDPAYYTNPNKFDPERFSDENLNNIKPYTYLPFGTGPRNCIGSRLALVEVKALIFKLLLKFEIVCTKKSNSTIKFNKKSLIPTSQDGFWFGLKRIKN